MYILYPRMRRSFCILILISVFFSLLSCSREAPVIYDYYWQINIIKDAETNKIYEKLTVFINTDDSDGFDDIDKVYLIHDKEELYWEVNPQTWYKANIQGTFWIGSNGFQMPNNSDIPEGEYRIVVEDIGGEYDEDSFFLKRPDIKKNKVSFPTPKITGKNLTIKGDSPVYSLWVYDKKWNYIQTPFEVKKEGFDFQRVLARKRDLESGFYFYLYIFDASIQRGIIGGPYYFSNE